MLVTSNLTQDFAMINKFAQGSLLTLKIQASLIYTKERIPIAHYELALANIRIVENGNILASGGINRWMALDASRTILKMKVSLEISKIIKFMDGVNIRENSQSFFNTRKL